MKLSTQKHFVRELLFLTQNALAVSNSISYHSLRAVSGLFYLEAQQQKQSEF